MTKIVEIEGKPLKDAIKALEEIVGFFVDYEPTGYGNEIDIFNPVDGKVCATGHLKGGDLVNVGYAL